VVRYWVVVGLVCGVLHGRALLLRSVLWFWFVVLPRPGLSGGCGCFVVVVDWFGFAWFKALVLVVS
jgi:hypothetical protein